MPPLLNRTRCVGLIYVTLWTLVQGGAAGAAAFSVRGLFEALHAGTAPPPLLLAALGGSGLLIALSRIAAGVMGERIGQDYALVIRQALFRHATHMPASDVAMRRNGYMSLRFVGDLSALRNWVGLGLPNLIAALILIPMAQAVLWYLDPGLGCAVLPIFATGFLLIGFGGIFLVPLHANLRQRRARIAADMAERMPLAPELGRMGRSAIEADQIGKHSHGMIDAAVTAKRLSEALKSLPDILSGIAALTVIWVGFNKGISTGTIAGALSALGIALFPMRELATVWDLHAGFRVAHAKCDNALNRRQRPRSNTGQNASVPLSIRIENLTCGALKGFSLRAEAGEIVELGDLNPPEKMQLFSVLSGLEIIEAGSLHLNDRPLTKVDQRHIVTVTAHPTILRGSLRRNLTLGLSPRPKASQIRRAARRTGFDRVIERLDGLDTRIAEGAKNLSISERAQLSLTRAMLCKPGLVMVTRCARVLDREAQATMMNWLKKSGATAILGT